MEENDKIFNHYVKLQIDSGLKPLEPEFFPIVPLDGVEAIAFRSSTKINSIIMGVMKQDDYVPVSDNRLCGVELFKHNIQHAIASLKEFDKAHKRCDFISVRCPAQLIEKTKLYDLVKEVLQKNPSIDPSRICIEFTENLLEQDVEKAKYAVLDMKILKLRTALVGVGREESKISKLVSVPVDLAIIDKEASKWAGDRNKPQLFNSLLSYIKAMGTESIVSGDEEKRKVLHYAEAVGFMFEGTDPISLEAAISVAEEVLD